MASMYQEKLRLREYGGMLDATPRTVDIMALTQRNSAASPLLRLPAEVRNKIFAYVNSGLNIFVDGGAIMKPKIIITTGNDQYATPAPPPFHALQATCRQIHSETALLPFSTNEYWYWTPDLLYQSRNWFYDAQSQCIRNISFHIKVIDETLLKPRRHFSAERLKSLRVFSHLQQVTIYLKTKHPKVGRLLEKLEAILRDHFKEAVSAGVKVVYEHHYHVSNRRLSYRTRGNELLAMIR